METAHIDIRHLCQVFALTLQLMALGIQEPHPKGAHGPHAAVIGGASPNGNGYLPVSPVQGVLNQFPCAVGRCVKGIAFFCRNHGKA